MARFSVPSGAGGNANTGDITFSDIEIIGAGTGSGDGNNYGTIELVPDLDLYANDQYLIVDPTDPNHIHIRGGGTQDESNSKLIFGGERNNVYISDSERMVTINVRPSTVSNPYTNTNVSNGIDFIASDASDISVDYVVNVGGTDYIVDSVTDDTPSPGLITVTASGAVFTAGQQYTFVFEPTYNYQWVFEEDGVLSGPAMGSVAVNGIYNNFVDDLYIGSSEAVVISSNNGQFLEDPDIADNQIATIGDLPTGATGSFTTTDSKTVTVTDGIITAITP